MSGPILYISFDGVLQPLAFSQAVRVVAALAKRGLPYHLLSVERKADVADRAKVERVERLLTDAGIDWTIVAVDLTHSVRSSAESLARVVASTLAVVRRRGVPLIHARGYQAGVVANIMRRTMGVAYLFDARGSWIDERADWFSHAGAYAAGKLVERRLYSDAAGVVTLTELHAGDVVDGVFGRKDRDRVVAIPTCADYDEFQIHASRPGKPSATSAVSRRLEGKNVIAIVGSLNRSYLAAETIRLAKLACDSSANAHLLVLSQQRDAYSAVLGRSDFAADRYTIHGAAHEEMPCWMDWIDWGLLLLPDVAAKRGSMPTKLAEFFASGVRPVAHGCNAEMTLWVRRAGSGVLVDAIDDASLKDAADRVAVGSVTMDDIRRARVVTAPHFSLASGVERYDALVRRIL